MQISYNLLKEYVDFDFSPEELSKHLSMRGIVSERTRAVFGEVEGVFIGKIIELKSLASNSSLSICTVDLKNKKLEVVCGAKNMKIGDFVPIVIEGGSLPGIRVVEGKEIMGFIPGNDLLRLRIRLEKGKSSGVLILTQLL